MVEKKEKTIAAKEKAVNDLFNKLHVALGELGDVEFQIRLERFQSAWISSRSAK